MPPKKGKKGGKKKEAQETKDEEAEPEISVLDKHYYLSQIQSLERNLDRLTQRSEQLVSAEEHAREQYRLLHQEKVDIVSFLKNRLKERENEIEEFKTRLTGLIKSTEDQKQKYEDRLGSLQKEFNQTKGDLSDQILSLTRKLESLEEFRIQKEKIDAEHKALEQLLEKEREENKQEMSLLQRTAVEEKESLVNEQKKKLAILTEQLREEAKNEIDETAKAALSESRTQFKTISALKSKIFKLRQENVDLRNNFRDLITREAVLQETLDSTTAISERREVALRRVVQKALEHATIGKEYENVLVEKDSLKRDLQQVQLQLDASTKLSCDIRESSAEKSIALDLLSTKLQEERYERRKIEQIIHSSLQLLQENIFSQSSEETQEDKSSTTDMLNTTLKLLIDLLSEAAQCTISYEATDQMQSTFFNSEDKKEVKNKPFATYTVGDLGLIPKGKAWK